MKSFKILFLLVFPCYLISQETFPVDPVSSNYEPIYAFTNAHIVISSEKEIKNGTLLIQGDKILLADSIVEIPKGSIIKDLDGDFIYPSFIDLYSNYGLPEIKTSEYSYYPQYNTNKQGAYHWNQAIHPEINACDEFNPNNETSKRYLNAGFGIVLTHKNDGISRGTAALVAVSENTPQKCMIRQKSASVFSFKKGSSKQRYPSSLMGSIALLRQLFLDTYWYKKSNSNENISFNALVNQMDLPLIFETHDPLDYSRIYNISEEFELDFIIKGNGREYEVINDIKKYEFPIIIPLNFPLKYNVENPEASDILTLSKLKRWETMPFNARILQDNNIPFCFTMSGIKNSEDFIKNLKISISKGLEKKNALYALTYYPALLMNQEETIGTLEKDKKANFIICSDNIFENGIIYENWINGKKYIVEEKNNLDIRGFYSLSSSIKDSIRKFSITGDLPNLKMKELISDTSSISYKISIEDEDIIFSNKDNSFRSIVSFQNNTLIGSYQTETGENIDIVLNRDSLLEHKVKKHHFVIDTVIPPIWTPNKSYGRIKPPSSSAVIFKNATIWTNEKEGILKNMDVAIYNGKILAIDTNLKKDNLFRFTNIDVEIIDATNKHITCGIIDEHSHIAISRGVNESGQAITSEVRIGDVINPNDHNIYRQLAGGVTAVQLLHGSANPIGGQSALIKLRWGSTAEEMKIKNADGFIKFALGENVKQSNWGSNYSTRFPQTRMGVEQVFYDAFYRAIDYKKNWEDYNSLKPSIKRKTLSPRDDLELNALLEILESKRFITCHSYVQSEINMLMHVADSFGFTLNTFTHILEGYKLSKEMKEHGAGASTFSDWWAYKFEVNDAIPYNAAILNQCGVVTAINSDDAEMGRRLNQEAAKAIKYGNTSEEDAWKMITLNPAILLHLDDRMGSIKVGKDADIVIWDSNPLSVYAKVENTYVDGKMLYNKQNNLNLLQRDLKEKMRIIKKMSEDSTQKKSQSVDVTNYKLYHCDDIEDDN